MASSLVFTPPPLDLDPLELSILERRGTFGLPPRQISDHLVNVFFSWIAPTLPVVDQDDFMRAYRGSGCDLSLLLLQAIYTIASRSLDCHGDLEDPDLTPRAFYKKAKALYDAGYEQNPTAVLQAVVLLSVYWDGPDDLRESGIFYWSHIGIALAQTQGLHTAERYSLLDPAEKGLLKRIWWTLYTRDRSVAAAFGRPAHINLADCTVEPLTEEDFVHSSNAQQAAHARYFLQYIKLCQIMDLGPCVNLASRAAGPRPRRDVDAARCELKLHEWLASCPMEFLWRPAAHNFWAAMLQSVFHTIVCQLHLSQKQSSRPSRTSAFHSATTIVSIMEALRCHEQLRYSPVFVICHAVVSLVTLKSQLPTCAPSLLHTTKLNIEGSLSTLRALSRTWPVVPMLLELFKTIVSPERIAHQVETAIDSYRTTNNIPGDSEDDDDDDGDTVRGAGDRSEEMQPDNTHAHAHAGEKASGTTMRPPPTATVVFRKPKMKQVILPESKLILQILRTETRWARPAAPQHAHAHSPQPPQPPPPLPSTSLLDAPLPTVDQYQDQSQYQFPFQCSHAEENMIVDDGGDDQGDEQDQIAGYFYGDGGGCFDEAAPPPPPPPVQVQVPLEEELDPETILRTLRRAIEMRGLVGVSAGDGNGGGDGT